MSSLVRDEQIRALKILLLESLTPLLRNEIHRAIKLHEVHDEVHSEDVDTLFTRIMEHWTKICSLIYRAHLLEDATLFQVFLTDKLLEDYANEPCKITDWTTGQAAVIRQHHDTAEGDDNDTAYQLRVVDPLEELMLDQCHVEDKLLLATACPGSHIRRLIGRKDWPSLATTLKKDRDLAVSLFREQPFDPGLFGDKGKRVLRGIDAIESKYFAKSSSRASWSVVGFVSAAARRLGPSSGSGDVTKDL